VAAVTHKQKRVLIVALIVHVIVLNLTWRDLRRRPASAVRGKKRMWRLASMANTSGSVAYWLFGRRRIPQPEIAEAVEAAA
jgi:type VI protein secretion system component VasK